MHREAMETKFVVMGRPPLSEEEKKRLGRFFKGELKFLQAKPRSAEEFLRICRGFGKGSKVILPYPPHRSRAAFIKAARAFEERYWILILPAGEDSVCRVQSMNPISWEPLLSK